MKSRGLAETIIRLGALLAFCLGLETAIPMTTQYVRMLLGPEQFPADHLWLELALVAEPLGILLALALLFGLSRPIAMLLAGPEPPVAQGPGCAILGVALLVRGAAGLGGALVTGHVGPAFAPLSQLGMGVALLGGIMGLSGLWRGAMAQRPKL